MQLSTAELAQARDTVQGLLDQLGLNAYLFEVEPRAGHWEVRVECAPNGGWHSSVLNVEEDWLAACRVDPGARSALLAEWRKRLLG